MPVRFESPLRNLCDVLTQIKASAKQYQTTLRKNEASTRAVLIDPILRALGWDTANTHMVEIESKRGSVYADYALFDVNRDPKIIVEAKSLGTALDDKKLIVSLFKYAVEFRLTEVFLTDGLVWHHYTGKDFQPKAPAPAKSLNITTDPAVEIAAYLVEHLDAARFWPVEDTDLLAQRIDQLESAVATLERQLSLQSPRHTASPRQPSKAQSESESAIDGASPTSAKLRFIELATLGDVTGKRPTHLRLPDGSVTPIKRWKDVLRESCKFALSTNPRIPIPLPDRSGKKVSLFAAVRPAAGLSFLAEPYNGRTIFIYLNYDANNCIANSEYVLRHAGKRALKGDPAVVLATEQ